MQAVRTEEYEREETVSFRVISDLQTVGINVSEIKKLQEAGLNTIGSVLQCSSRDLVQIKGLTDARVEKIKEAARKLDCRGTQFKTGLEVKEKRRKVIRNINPTIPYIPYIPYIHSIYPLLYALYR
jgi:DNA-directed RNA polymerase alpha subunit